MSETLVSLWTDVRRRLEAAGIDTPVFDARLLLEAGASVSRLDIVTDPRRVISAEQVAAVDALTRRREAREPVAHIIGRRHFWTLDLEVSPDVLIPRPETELLVEAALKVLDPNQPARSPRSRRRLRRYLVGGAARTSARARHRRRCQRGGARCRGVKC